MHRRHPFPRPWLALSLAGALLCAQWLLAQHGANLEQHASSHACEWCLTHAPLQAGVPAAVLPLPMAAGEQFLSVVVFVVLACVAWRVYRSRAPPHFLSV